MLPETMDAWVVDAQAPGLRRQRLPLPACGPNDLLVKVRACGVCRTDLHLVDHELGRPQRPVVPGHEVVGQVLALGEQARGWRIGQRVGIPWLGGTCGACPYCGGGQENLCDHPVFTGRDRDGGYAGYCVADARWCLPLPEGYDDIHAAPLLCAGLIGFRTWRMGQGAGGPAPRRIGIWGFGAAAHLVCQLAVAHGQEVHAFTRDGDLRAQAFARRLGATWAGGSSDEPPQLLDAALIFAPVGALVPAALAAVRKGGVVVCGGIHMSPIPSFDYDLLWGERTLCSVANLTRQDGLDFMALAGRIALKVQVQPFPLDQADIAVARLRAGEIDGAAVLVP